MIKSPNQSLNTIHRYVILFLIRAPAKGATTTIQKLSRCIRHFNPRSREGSDVRIKIVMRYLKNFNPRSREGSDGNKNAAVKKPSIFQSTLPRRERHPLRAPVHPGYQNFNPRSREGSDKGAAATAIKVSDFNPRSREGSDSNIIQQISFSLYNTVYFVSNNIK